MKKLRVVVVGLGRIGWQFHVPQISRHEGFTLVGTVDPLAQRRSEAEQTFGGRSYGDLEPCLVAEKPDLVVIASPTPFHAPQAIAAFAHGCDVFCDKPMAPSLAEADAMIAAARRKERKLMVYQPQRAVREMVALQAILAQDLLGSVYLMKFASTNYARRNDWQAFTRHGGGMLNNFGAHEIDRALYLTGEKARRVVCRLRTIASLGDADDVVKALIETESGVLLDIDINMAAAQHLPSVQVFGSRGSALLEGAEWKLRYFDAQELEEVSLQDGLAAEQRRYGSGESIPWKETVFPVADFAPVDFYQRCYEYFALDQPPFVPLEQTREVLRVMDLCRKSDRGEGQE